MKTAGFLLLGVLLVWQARSQGFEPMCGFPTLRNPTVVRDALARTLSENPSMRLQMEGHEARLRSADLKIGVIDTFFTYNFTTGQFNSTSAELRATGTISYIWVELNELQNGNIDSTVIEAVRNALENKTPPPSKDSTKGILQLDRQFFGDPPNINSSFVKGAGDGKTHFLIYDIKDGWTGTGGYVAGYFFDVDVDPDIAPGVSNRRDMLYIDSYPGIYYLNQRDPERPLGTLAHEFQHLIHWNYDKDEETFFNEGLSEYASYVCGYGLRSPEGYLSDPGVTFLGWRFGDNVRVLDDYSRSALWTLYVGEQYGSNFIQKFTQNPGVGIQGFDAAMAAAGGGTNFAAAVLNFHIATYLQDRQVNSAYGYIDTTVIQTQPKVYKNILGARGTGGKAGLPPLAADYVRFSAVDTIFATFTLSLGSASIRALRFTDSQSGVRIVYPGVQFGDEFSGSNRAEVVFLVHNNGQFNYTDYSYSSTGASKGSIAFELKHDDGGITFSNPNTLFLNNDTAFVVFEGVEGGKIDSIAFWFQSTGTAGLLVRDANTKYDLLNNPTTGLGAQPRMPAGSVAFSVSDTGFFKTVVDLRSYDIASSPDFVVEMVYGTGAPDPLLRRDSSQSILHSYLSLIRQPSPGITMYRSFGDFYLRAYLSPGGPVTPPPPPPIPALYSLHQNYPNPFNPSTIIKYDLSRSGHVRLEVFDLLGRRVAVLVDEFQNAGSSAPVVFDASSLSAGIYFYRLTAGKFVHTKKMVVVR